MEPATRSCWSQPRSGLHRAAGLGWKSSFVPARVETRSPAVWRSPGPDADEMEPLLLREPVRVRMGAEQEPRRRAPVGRQGRRSDNPDAHDPSRKHVPTMLTTDLSLRFDPLTRNLAAILGESGRARGRLRPRVFKLTHRTWARVCAISDRRFPPKSSSGRTHPCGRPQIDRCAGHRRAQGKAAGFRTLDRGAGFTAWASAATFRGSDKRVARTVPGFAWPRRRTGRSTSLGNSPSAQDTRGHKGRIQQSRGGGKKISLADLIVLGAAQASSGGKQRRHK